MNILGEKELNISLTYPNKYVKSLRDFKRSSISSKLNKPSVAPKDEKLFFKLVKAAFSQRRKTLVNALSGSGAFGTKEEITKAIEKANFSPTIRGEALSIEEFCSLSDIFANN